jgi:hypothetical protein
LAFVQDGAAPDAAQGDFIREVQAWDDGVFRAGFKGPADLRDALIRALHDFELAHAAGKVDPNAILRRARELLPDPDRHRSYGPFLSLAIAGGPVQQILRPAEVEAPALAEALHKEALFGSTRILSGSLGIETEIDGTALVLSQERGGTIRLDEDGAILLRLPLDEADRHSRSSTGFQAIIEERVLMRISAALGYASWLLDHIDRTQRLTHVACGARIEAGGYMAWRTQREQDASPNGGTVTMMSDEDRPPVSLHKPRPALRLDRQRLAEDLLVPLRRQWKQR